MRRGENEEEEEVEMQAMKEGGRGVFCDAEEEGRCEVQEEDNGDMCEGELIWLACDDGEENEEEDGGDEKDDVKPRVNGLFVKGAEEKEEEYDKEEKEGGKEMMLWRRKSVRMNLVC